MVGSVFAPRNRESIGEVDDDCVPYVGSDHQRFRGQNRHPFCFIGDTIAISINECSRSWIFEIEGFIFSAAQKDWVVACVKKWTESVAVLVFEGP